ncbi:unnamed protein product [Sphenostylis stenocarpa]|uniref:Uncharacterized protein n=1 Tax=Sphenostylis stenocarpa TaxID=92480 RepID=A0AA86SM68_9FABA|nr:unnamed protein product [Sphenostylis stenocarpa]
MDSFQTPPSLMWEERGGKPCRKRQKTKLPSLIPSCILWCMELLVIPSGCSCTFFCSKVRDASKGEVRDASKGEVNHAEVTGYTTNFTRSQCILCKGAGSDIKPIESRTVREFFCVSLLISSVAYLPHLLRSSARSCVLS